MNQRIIRTASTAALLLAATAIGCGDDETTDVCGDGGAGTEPAWAIASSVFGDAGTATYVSVLDSLEPQSIDLAEAAEYAGFATIGAVDGMLFVGDGEAPEITRYDVQDGGCLVDRGTIDFGFYGLQTAPLYLNAFADANTAYMRHDTTKRVIWDPTAFELRGIADDAAIVAERDGLQVKAGYDRSVAVRDGQVFHPFYWSDANYYRFAAGSQIAVYAAENDSLVDLIDAPCPGLDVASQDEAGNLYFSNWVFAAAAPVLDEAAPATCTVRINAGELAIDATWTNDLSTMVEGRQTAAFRYLEGGLGVVAALDADRIEIGAETDPNTIKSDANWRLWMVNLETGTGTPVEGLGHIAGGYNAFRVGGRTLLLLPAADYASTTVYELTPDGKAQPLFETAGWAYQFVQVR